VGVLVLPQVPSFESMDSRIEPQPVGRSDHKRSLRNGDDPDPVGRAVLLLFLRAAVLAQSKRAPSIDRRHVCSRPVRHGLVSAVAAIVRAANAKPAQTLLACQFYDIPTSRPLTFSQARPGFGSGALGCD
jgi:hypothetical protein